MDDKKLIVVIDGRESLLLSIARDVVSFGFMIGTALILNVAMPPSGWLNAALAFIWVVWMIGRSQRHKLSMTIPQVREWAARQGQPA